MSGIETESVNVITNEAGDGCRYLIMQCLMDHILDFCLYSSHLETTPAVKVRAEDSVSNFDRSGVGESRII